MQAEEERTYYVGTVVSGVLRLQKTLQDGRQQIVGLLLPGDMFGRVFFETSNVSIEAASGAMLCCYNRTDFEALLVRFPELEHRMLLSVLDTLDVAQEWMLLLGCQSVMERVTTFLLIIRRRASGPWRTRPNGEAGASVSVPISRRDMAAYLSTTVESISRTVQDLARQEVIRIIDPHCFEILDESRLLRLSGRDEADWESSREKRVRIA